MLLFPNFSSRVCSDKSYAQTGHAYRCFCPPSRLATTRERLAKTGSSATYDKSCLHLTEEEATRRVKAGERWIVRLNVSDATNHE